jgi:hypothetical protein
MRERAKSQTAILKRKETFASIQHQQGVNNSQFGKCWIYSLEHNCNKSISRDDLDAFLALGWVKGRKMKF